MMRNHTAIAMRSLLGLLFVVAPLSSALHVFPEPQLPPNAAAFVDALTKTGYMLPLIRATELAAGCLLLLGLLVPVAVLLLAPVVVNIITFHAFLAPRGLGVAAVVGVLEGVVAWQHRAELEPLLGVGEIGALPARRPASLGQVRATREEG